MRVVHILCTCNHVMCRYVFKIHFILVDYIPTEVKLDIMCLWCTTSYIVQARDIGCINYAQYLQTSICRLKITY